jgi:type I restriction enzyme S subunit
LLKQIFSNEDIIGNGAIFNSVGKEELMKFKILNPNLTLAEKFNTYIDPVDKKIEILYKKLDNLSKTKNFLIPRLISGRLSVEKFDVEFPSSMDEESIAS